ncbi:hypothetical protein AM403_06695 [Proteus mirabilis]|nr:hypothetical protein AM403_06695 [Proteus mirabilis]
MVVAKKKFCAQSLNNAGLSVSKACQLTLLSRSAFYRQPINCLKKGSVVSDAIQSVLAKSPQSIFWSAQSQI